MGTTAGHLGSVSTPFLSLSFYVRNVDIFTNVLRECKNVANICVIPLGENSFYLDATTGVCCQCLLEF